MNTKILFSTAVSALLAITLIVNSSIVHAQTEQTVECVEAQTDLASAMSLFRNAYFERDGATESAESVMADKVMKIADNVYQQCPAETVSAVKAGLKKANASLEDPNRAELVACDKALKTIARY